MLATNLEVIQMHGLCVVGTPVVTSDYVREYVRNKCDTICKDVETMRICSDPLIRYHLLKFCMNTRLSFLSRNVTQITWQHPVPTLRTLALCMLTKRS
jgi:hypothetical protein